MGTTTVGVKLDDALRARLRRAADAAGRTPHWLIKQALVTLLDRMEQGETPRRRRAARRGTGGAAAVPGVRAERAAAIGAARRHHRRLSPAGAGMRAVPARRRRGCRPTRRRDAQALATQLVEALRGKRRGGGVEGLIHEFSLSSQEGVALMCLAEALLRIPDRATRDALIRDKIASGDWQRASRPRRRRCSSTPRPGA